MPDATTPDQLVDTGTIEQRLNVAFADADATRLAGLQHAQVIYAARRASLEMDRARVAQKYGAQSVQAADVQTRLDAHAVASRALDADTIRASVPAFQLSTDSAIVHGFVVRDPFEGVRGAVVSAVDATGRPIAEAKTNDTGYFKIVLSTGTQIGRLNVAAPRALVQLNVTVNGRVVVEDKEPIELSAGQAAYRELVVGELRRDR